MLIIPSSKGKRTSNPHGVQCETIWSVDATYLPHCVYISKSKSIYCADTTLRIHYIISIYLKELAHLEDLLFVGNPLYDGCELEAWRSEAARRLPNLKKLDGETVLREDDPPLTVADMQVAFFFNLNFVVKTFFFLI